MIRAAAIIRDRGAPKVLGCGRVSATRASHQQSHDEGEDHKWLGIAAILPQSHGMARPQAGKSCDLSTSIDVLIHNLMQSVNQSDSPTCTYKPVRWSVTRSMHASIPMLVAHACRPCSVVHALPQTGDV
jgi:hypothetical protein